jgi:hypothetical protein
VRHATRELALRELDAQRAHEDAQRRDLMARTGQ